MNTYKTDNIGHISIYIDKWRDGEAWTHTVKEGIFDGFLEVFWIFLKNEHDKPIGTPDRRTGGCRENQALCNLII